LVVIEERRRVYRNGLEEQLHYQAAPRSDEMDCKVHETLTFQE